MASLTRKERDDKRKRREILAAALAVFAEGGFHNTTMARISKAAQYPLGTIYKYFPGKKEMYHDLVIERVHELGRILQGQPGCGENIYFREKQHRQRGHAPAQRAGEPASRAHGQAV
jgi:AcrR family transcriptional regulator